MHTAGIDEIDIVVNDGRPLRAKVRDRLFAEEISLEDGPNAVRIGSVVRRVWLSSASMKPPAGYRPVYGHFGLDDGCLECHKTDDSGKLTLSGEREEICRWCHGDLSRGRRGVPWVSVHAPVRAGKCLVCHAPHISAKKGLPADKPPMCADCHAAVTDRLKTDRFVHGPMNLGDCRLCHTVHSSAEPKLLVRPATGLCTDCHSDVLPPAGTPACPATSPDDPRGSVRPLPRAALLGEPAHAPPARRAPLPGVPRGQDPQLPRGQGLLDLRLRQVPRSSSPDAAAPDHGCQPLSLHPVSRFSRRGGVHPRLRRRGQVLPLPQLPRGAALGRCRFALPRLPPRQPASARSAPRGRDRAFALYKLPPPAPGAPRPAAARRGAHPVQGTRLRGVPSRPGREDRAGLPSLVHRLPSRQGCRRRVCRGVGAPALPRQRLQQLPPQSQCGNGERPLGARGAALPRLSPQDAQGDADRAGFSARGCSPRALRRLPRSPLRGESAAASQTAERVVPFVSRGPFTVSRRWSVGCRAQTGRRAQVPPLSPQPHFDQCETSQVATAAVLPTLPRGVLRRDRRRRRGLAPQAGQGGGVRGLPRPARRIARQAPQGRRARGGVPGLSPESERLASPVFLWPISRPRGMGCRRRSAAACIATCRTLSAQRKLLLAPSHGVCQGCHKN